MNHRDVVIIGAGLAGATAAVLLARRGLKVTLIDPRAEFPPLFRAEKIEPDQAALLRKFDLLEAVRPRTRLIREIIRAQGGRVRLRRQVEQFGISYQDIVNQMRAQIPPEVEFKIGRVQSLSADAQQPGVVMADGSTYSARLVVLSSGTGGNLQAQIGVRKKMVQDELSVAFGFVLSRPDGTPFPFDAVTYRPSSTRERVGYLTLFRIGQIVRANLFVYWETAGPLTQAFIREPKKELLRALPGIDRVIGDFEVTGRVETCRIDLYRVEDCVRPGVVILADAYQSVCPATGMGLSKVLTDVDTLCNECIPDWLATPGMDTDKIARFYANERKRLVDDRALQHAVQGREVATNPSLAWRARRAIGQWRWAHGR